MKAWIAVASADHVRQGRASGFMQVCHGKAAPLRRIAAGDGVVYYSPRDRFQGGETLRAFTALGHVKRGEPYAFDMGGGFVPYRRNVNWMDVKETPIDPLLPLLDFTARRRNWGYQLRFGLIELSLHDFNLIADAMGAPHPACSAKA